MIQITKDEAMALRKRYPDLGITITNRQTSHKKYYTEESTRVVGFLERFNRERNRQMRERTVQKHA